MGMDISRLEDLSPGLAARIALASDASARMFAQRVARLACQAVGVDDPAALALTDPSSMSLSSGSDIARVGQLEIDFDDDYFALHNAERPLTGPEEDSMQRNFTRARAMSSVLKSLDVDPRTAAQEAAYEALFAGCDEQSVEALGREAL